METFYIALYALLLVTLFTLTFWRGEWKSIATLIILIFASGIGIGPIHEWSLGPIGNTRISLSITLGLILGLFGLIFGNKEIRIGSLSYYLFVLLTMVFLISSFSV